MAAADATPVADVSDMSAALAVPTSKEIRANNEWLALHYAKAGMAVFPCAAERMNRSDGSIIEPKQPLIAGGFKSATTDENQIRLWWRKYPDALPALSCLASGLIVIDADIRAAVEAKPAKDSRAAVRAKAAVNGMMVLGDLAKKNGIVLTASPCVDTPSGGGHCYYRLPPGMEATNSTGTLPDGLDVRGAGYVVAPGAMRRDGRRYSRVSGSPDLAAAFKAATIPVLPDAFAACITAGKPVEPPLPIQGALEAAPASTLGPGAPLPQPGEPAAVQPRPSAATARDTGYARAALDGKARDLAALGKGGRNKALNDHAYVMARMAAAGWIDRAAVEPALMAAAVSNRLAADDGQDSAAATFASGWNGGMQAGPHNPLPAEFPILPSVAALVAGMQASAGAAHGAGVGGQQQATAAPAFVALPPPPAIVATPFEWQDPATIPRHVFLYGTAYARKGVSATIAAGGVGKSLLLITECLALASGRNLIGVNSAAKLAVWYYNGEDGRDMLQSRVTAAMQHHDIKPSEIVGALYLNSGRDNRWIVADTLAGKTVVHKPIVDGIIAEIEAKGIAVLVVDPFITSHNVNENDNGAIAAVVAEWNRVADITGCAIMLVHHARKSSGGVVELTADSTRGASAFMGAVRYARIMRHMTAEEAARAGVDIAIYKQHVEIVEVKSNFSGAESRPTWLKLVSCPLANGDDVGAVEKWTWPHKDAASEYDDDMVFNVQEVARPGEYKLSPRSKEWLGYHIGHLSSLT